VEEFIKPYRRYAQFEGRSDRKEFWYYVLFYLIVGAILSVVDQTLFGGRMIDFGGNDWGQSHWDGDWSWTWGWGWGWGVDHKGPLGSIFSLISLDPLDLGQRPAAARHQQVRLVFPVLAYPFRRLDLPAGLVFPPGRPRLERLWRAPGRQSARGVKAGLAGPPLTPAALCSRRRRLLAGIRC
jgi:hypothetical protein